MSDRIAFEADLLDALLEIGGGAEMAAWAFEGLAARLLAAGKPVDELTVAELLAGIRAQRAHLRSLP